MLSPAWPRTGGAILIDRDPCLFPHILNFLRSGQLPPPSAWDAVASEADFYGLVSLLDVLKPSRLEAQLGAASLRILQEENAVRSRFGPAAGPIAPGSGDELLINVFDEEPWRIDLSVPPGLQLLFERTRGSDITVGEAATVAPTEFERSWADFSMLPFRLSTISGVVAAGGAVLASLLPQNRQTNRLFPETYRNGRNAFNGSDVDLFLVGLSEAEARQRILDVRAALGQSVTVIARTNTTVTFHCKGRDVQIVLRRHASVAEVLTGFDLDCCCFATSDGVSVQALPRGRRALLARYNLAGVDASRESYNYESRLLKYANRGWAVACPLVPAWRTLLDPRITAAPIAGGGFELRGFAKLVAWEAASLRGEKEIGVLKKCGGETFEYEYGEAAPIALFPRHPGKWDDAARRLWCAAASGDPLHFVFVVSQIYAWMNDTFVDNSRGDIEAVLDVDAQDGRALRFCHMDTETDPSTWSGRYTTTAPRRVAFVGHAPGQRWPYTGAPSGGDPAAWFAHAWREHANARAAPGRNA